MQVAELRVGVVGVGSRTVHGEAWARTVVEMPSLRLVGVTDDDEEAAQRTAKALGVKNLGTDPRAVLEAEDVDIAIVNSVDHRHEEDVNAALDAGKHVITDKPLGVDGTGAARIARKSREKGLKVAIGHVFRFAPSCQFVKKRAEAGDLGKLFQVEAGYVHDLRRVWKLTPWRTDPKRPQDPWFGGALHPIDLVQWIGGEISEVCAVENKATSRDEHPLADNQILLLKFASGAVGRVWNTFGIRQSPEFSPFCNAFGDRGSCLASLQRNAVEFHIDWGVGPVSGPITVPFAPGVSLNRLLIEDFLEAVRKDGRPLIDAEEGARAMSVVDAAVKSVKSGRFERVQVPVI